MPTTKTFILLLCLLFISYNSSAQPLNPKDQLALNIPEKSSYSTDEISAYIKSNFQSDSERVRAIFVWIASNINYDADLLLSKINPTGRQPVDDVLKTRKAVCGGYTDLFTELCSKCNIRSMLVGGYVKRNQVASRLAHAWPVVALNGSWYLFDPTWAAGYLDNDRFTRKFSETYYKLLPSEMIRDHMPFDPMNQFLDYPVTNKEFMEGKSSGNKKQVFHYVDTLNKYVASSKDEQARQEMRRLQNNGIENDVISERLKFLVKSLESYGSKTGFDQALALYNQAVSSYNGYLQDKNKQFTSVRDEKELQHVLDSASYYANASWVTLGTVVAQTDAHRDALSKTYRAIEQFHGQLNKEKSFINSYLATEKASRIKLFMKKP